MSPKKSSSSSTGRAVGPAGIAAVPSFSGLVLSLVPPAAARKASASAPLAHLDYPGELQVKNQGLRLFWQHHRLPGHPEPVAASPRPRHYRTTSKRRTIRRGPTLFLLFGDKSGHDEKIPFVESPLEPSAHSSIFRFLQRRLSEPSFRLVAQHLSHLVIRGSYAEMAVIFNVDALNGPLVRKLKMLAGHLQKLPQPVAAAFIYHDPSRSDYYLESRRPAEGLHLKKLFGRDQLMVSYDGRRYLYHPTSFSQVNESMVATMLAKAKELLDPAPGQHLLDLYCGYGLFSHFLSPHYRQVVGLDAEGPSIKAAAGNARLNPGSGNTRFLARRITGELLTETLSAPGGPEVVLLDPPRQGPQAGVIAALCRRRPQRVLHVFCAVDQIPASLSEWHAGGYQVHRVVPLDMFAGTANLEILILLAPEPGGSRGRRRVPASERQS